jgi:hypothetical protein
VATIPGCRELVAGSHLTAAASENKQRERSLMSVGGGAEMKIPI